MWNALKNYSLICGRPTTLATQSVAYTLVHTEHVGIEISNSDTFQSNFAIFKKQREKQILSYFWKPTTKSLGGDTSGTPAQYQVLFIHNIVVTIISAQDFRESEERSSMDMRYVSALTNCLIFHEAATSSDTYRLSTYLLPVEFVGINSKNSICLMWGKAGYACKERDIFTRKYSSLRA